MVSNKFRVALSALEDIFYLAENPTYNNLEVGFRHSPLSQGEIAKRHKDTLDYIADIARLTLEDLK